MVKFYNYRFSHNKSDQILQGIRFLWFICNFIFNIIFFQIANSLGGLGTSDNLVPMDPKLNTGEFKGWESEIKSFLNSTPDGLVEIDIVIDYDGNSSRWSVLHYKAHFKKNGKPIYSKSAHFKNSLNY